MSRDKDFKATLYYYIRRGWYDQLLNACEKKGKDNIGITTFWKAFAIGAGGNISECIRLLSNFQARPDMQYPVSLALAYFHQQASVVDHDALSEIKSALSMSEDVVKEVGIVLAARFSLVVGDYNNALRLCTRVLSRTQNPSTPGELEAVTITHWLNIYDYLVEANASSSRDLGDLNKVEYFVQSKASILEIDLDDLMAWAASKQVLGDKEGAVAVLNQIIAAYSNFMPAYAEKGLIMSSVAISNAARSFIKTRHELNANWVDILDLAYRLTEDYQSLDGYTIIAVHDLTQDIHSNSGIEKLLTLEKNISSKEPNNARILYESASLFVRICSRNPRALQICTNMMTACCKLQPSNAKYICELAHCYVLQRQYDTALKHYRDATKRDSNCVAAVEGMIFSQILAGDFDDAEAQLELLALMHGGNDDNLSADMAYIKSLLSLRHTPGAVVSFKRQTELLNLARAKIVTYYDALVNSSVMVFTSVDGSDELSTSQLSEMARGGNIYGVGNCLRNELMILNPDLLFQIGVSYFCAAEPAANLELKPVNSLQQKAETTLARPNTMKQEISPGVLTGMGILSSLISQFPSFVSVYIELARCFHILGQHDSALNILNQFLGLHGNENDLPEDCSVVLLFKAKIEASRKNARLASRYLEQCLSNDFAMRSQSLYKLVQIMIFSQQAEKLEEALLSIESLLSTQSVEFKQAATSSQGEISLSKEYINNSLRITDEDRVSLYIVYASVLSKMKRLKEANKILAEAKVIFAGTSNPYQEVQILIASSQLSIERNDYDNAIRMLDKIPADNPIFNKVQVIKAEILLNFQRDREGYIQCYKILLEKIETDDGSTKPMRALAYSNLGDAYLRVLNPEQAVEAFENAFRLDYTNVQLRVKIGKALVATHEYHRAVDFYEAALRDIGKQIAAGADASIGIASESVVLSHDLAKLYLKLSRLEAASRVLLKILNDDSFMNNGGSPKSKQTSLKDTNNATMVSKRDDVKTLLLLIEVYKLDSNSKYNKGNGDAEIIAAWYQIKSLQLEVVRIVRSGATSVVGSSSLDSANGSMSGVELEKFQLSKYCVGLANALTYKSMNGDSRIKKIEEFNEVESILNEALQHNPQNSAAMLSLAKLFKGHQHVKPCHISVIINHCQKVALSDNENEEAAILLSNALSISYQQQLQQQYANSDGKSNETSPVDSKEGGTNEMSPNKPSIDPEAIIKPLKDFLALHPTNYIVMDKLILHLRRMGRLQEALPLFEASEKHDKRCIAHSGYNYCRGLYARYTNDVIQAVQRFNLARKDTKKHFGESSLIHMIELYLNPDQDGIWTAIEENDEKGGSSDSVTVSDTSAENIKVADMLLKELKPICRDERRFTILESYCLLASRQKLKVEKAKNNFLELLEKDGDYLPAILGTATGFMMEKNPHKARNLLKRVVKMDALKHDGEDFEKANLLLARFSADKTKNDNQTQDLCKKCLWNNKSCSQAWDILGTSFEREANFLRACECYEKAWKLEFEASAPMGFKYAYCLLKNKQFVEAIDVCERVLAQYPDYPRIKEEILVKAQLGIRCF